MREYLPECEVRGSDEEEIDEEGERDQTDEQVHEDWMIIN